MLATLQTIESENYEYVPPPPISLPCVTLYMKLYGVAQADVVKGWNIII